MDRGWGEVLGGVLVVRACRGGLLIQQKLGGLLEPSRQRWALLQLSWEAPWTVSGGHDHGWTGGSEATEWSPFGFSHCLLSALWLLRARRVTSSPSWWVVHSYVGQGTLWHQELCESRLRCFLSDFEQVA